MKLRAVWTLVLVLASACEPGAVVQDAGSADTEPAQERQRPIEVFSWWKRGGKGASLAGLFAEHARHHPADTMIHASSDFSGQARKTLRSRMLAGDPPDTFQANAGADLIQWAKADGLDTHDSKLVALSDELPITAELKQAMPEVLVDAISVRGSVYGIPSNIHRLNTLFYNTKVFEKHGLSPPRTVDDIFGIAERLKGTGVFPMAIGGREPWTLSLLVFESLLVSREGMSFYREYFTGKLPYADRRVVATLEQALELSASFNVNYGEITWLQALELVIAGQAAMTVIGDWARVVYAERGLRVGVDFVEIPFPGTENAMVFTSDTFAIPVRAKNKRGAERLLTTMATVAGQRAMHGGNATMPARFDVPIEDSDPALRQKVVVLRTGQLGLALSGLVPQLFHEDLSAALAETLKARDLEPMMQTLRSRYVLLTR